MMTSETLTDDTINDGTAPVARRDWRTIDKATARRRITRLATLMDDAIELPGIKKKIGYDGIIGLIPGVGDLATSAVSGYIIVEAARAGVPNRAIASMLGRLCLDTLIGAIPIAGDLFDFAYKANRRNAKTALEHLDSVELGPGPLPDAIEV